MNIIDENIVFSQRQRLTDLKIRYKQDSEITFVGRTRAAGYSRASQNGAMKVSKRVELGEYVVADPEICHGQLTFKGTRIMVKTVLFYIGQGKDWTWISGQYFGKVSREAVAEAVKLPNEALVERTEG